MTVTGGVAHSVALVAIGVVSQATVAAGAPTARLKAISSRFGATGASLVIEASEPVPYVTTRPDPLTVLLEFRNAIAEGIDNSAKADARSPVARVSVEPDAAMGTPVSRVRVALTQPAGYRVRSERNRVVVEFDRRSASPRLKTTAEAAGARVELPAVDPIVALGLGASLPEFTGRSRAAAALLEAASQANAQSQTKQAQSGQAQSGQAAPTQPAQRSGRTYSGDPVSLDFQQADLRAVLRVFSEISGLNIVIDPKVQGTVDVALRDVPWDQALDIILRANGLDYRVDGTVVRIAPRDVFTAEDKGVAEAAEARAAAEHLTTLTRQLSYARGEDIVKLLKDTRVISKYGQAQIDPRTNTIIITDVSAYIPQAQALIDALDKAQPQVEIEARIVQANKNFARRLGIQWGFNGRVDPTLGNTTNLAFPNNGSLDGRAGTQGPGQTGTAVNLGVPSPNSAVGLALGAINGAFNLDVALTAAENSGNLRVLSTPRVSAQNNGEAEITQGVQIPIQTVANNTVTVTFKDAALTLRVTPQISAAGTVIMKIALENAQPDFSRAVNGIPPINTQRANTQVLVGDGQTTVIGGIFISQQQASTDRTPGLGQIPLIKWLFRRDALTDDSTELLIFITPRIVKG